MVIIVILAVSAALIAGALWGTYGRLPKRLQGFLVAMSGGALIVSVMVELIEPASEHAPLWIAMSGVAMGAVVFTLLDRLLDSLHGGEEEKGGLGLLLSVTLDGIPENLALGVALVSAGVSEVAALAGSILLSNLPEAAGGAKRMQEAGWSKPKVVALWTATAGLLAGAALFGNDALRLADETLIAFIQCFAAGAVAASLATAVFPQAFEEDNRDAGIAVAVGLIVAFMLTELGG